jgi:hypothetical protein
MSKQSAHLSQRSLEDRPEIGPGLRGGLRAASVRSAVDVDEVQQPEGGFTNGLSSLRISSHLCTIYLTQQRGQQKRRKKFAPMYVANIGASVGHARREVGA